MLIYEELTVKALTNLVSLILNIENKLKVRKFFLLAEN